MDRECLVPQNDYMQILLGNGNGSCDHLTGLCTFVFVLWFHAHCVSQKESIVSRDCLLMFLKGFGIKPHKACFVHMGQKHELVLIGDFLSVGVMLPILA
jgi:hypothetical protein